ncbi:cytochrome c-type biogenesis protein CcmH, partial [SAR202 cluster bacterium AD-802-E10_MRT_200m]|nr:cytochrome c-type biogenesis protein CcmH [SAR202 cluster bacterium AD-802-E10_MRT_200m]
ETIAQGIDRRLVCPVCPGETIDQSQVELAKQMQVIVREKLRTGESEEDILKFFVERYGESVLAAPSKQGFNLIVWLFPPFAAIIFLLVLIIVIRDLGTKRPKGQFGRNKERTLPVEKLDNYLLMVDEELAGRKGIFGK